jgi:hypothetical protein
MPRTWRTLAPAVALALALPLAAQVERGGALPGPLPLFPPDNWWNVDVSAAPVDPGSAAFLNFIGPDRKLHPDLGGDADPAPLIYGIPYVVVPGGQPMEQVSFLYADESDYQAPGRPPGYPIPVQARSEPKWIEGGQPGGGNSGDRHMLIVDRDNRILYELYALRWNGSSWEAGSGAIFPLDSNARRPEGWTSADAAGLAILPGLIRYDEAFGSAPIGHAFRVTVRATNGYVYPASHRAGSTSGALPMGARLRLKASKSLSGYPPEVQRIFQAMKTHGLIVADNGSDMYVTGTYDTRWNNSVLNPAFRSLTAIDFEVIQLGWKPAETPPCTAVSITSQPANVTIRKGEGATFAVAASGTAPIAHQWYRGATGNRLSPIPDGTTSSLTVFPDETTSYWVAVSNACGSIESVTATAIVEHGRRRPIRR